MSLQKSSEELIGSRNGREQSPKVEMAMQELLYDAFHALMTDAFLYQNRKIDIGSVIAHADTKYPKTALEDEFNHRPWVPSSKIELRERKADGTPLRGGAQPLGTSDRERELRFFIPTISTHCGPCRSKTLHDAEYHDERRRFDPTMDRLELGNQIFAINLTCQYCKSSIITFLFKREKLTIQLCGRTEPPRVEVPDEIPKNLRPIYGDALRATICGDFFAGFYHLRSFMEHHMRGVVQIPDAEQIRGDDLCVRYNASIDPFIAQRAPLRPSFERCSSNLHSRKGSKEQFQDICALINAHFALLKTLASLPPPTETK